MNSGNRPSVWGFSPVTPIEAVGQASRARVASRTSSGVAGWRMTTAWPSSDPNIQGAHCRETSQSMQLRSTNHGPGTLPGCRSRGSAIDRGYHAMGVPSGRPMRKAFLVTASCVAALALLVVLLAGIALRRMDSPAFRQALLDRVAASLGVAVRAKEVEVDVLSGIRLRGVEIANPAPFKGNLVAADEFVFRYRLLPLVFGRFEVNRLSLGAPALVLAMDSNGGCDYARLAMHQTSSTTVPLRVSISKLAVDDARITVADAARATLLAVEDLDFDSSFEVGPEGALGKGELRAARLALASGVAATSLKAPLEIARGVVKVAPLRASLAGGDVKGAMTVRLADVRAIADLELEGVDVQKLAAEARSRSGIVGRLNAKASVEGSGGVESLKGQGNAAIDSCRVEQSRLFSLMASALRLPELLNPNLSECRVEFTLGGGRVTTPVVRLKGPTLQLDGRGTVTLRSDALDYDMTLALSNPVLDRLPAKELKAAFKDRGDGFGSIAFHVSGTTASPQTDLLTRVGAAAAAEAAKGKVRKILDKLF